jgi:hypothetical protein
MKKIVLFMLATVLITGCSDLPAEPGRPGSVTDSLFGFATGGFLGPAGDQVTTVPSGDLTFAVGDDSNTVAITVQDTVIYNTGYYTLDGQDWQSYSLNGDTTISNWHVGSANASIGVSRGDVSNSSELSIVAYYCTWNSGWNCHGSVWQQRVLNITVESCTATQCLYDGTCYDDGVQHPVQPAEQPAGQVSQETICDAGSWTNQSYCAGNYCYADGTCYGEQEGHPNNDQICLSGNWRAFPDDPSTV